MKDCTRCIHAKWDRTEAGKLHPSGNGECTKEVKIPELPASKYYYDSYSIRIQGGQINRRKELKQHCVYYST